VNVAKAEGNAFQDGANDVGAGVRSGEANQGARAFESRLRRALANQIGSPQEAAEPAMDFGGFGGELVIGSRRRWNLLQKCRGTSAARGRLPG